MKYIKPSYRKERLRSIVFTLFNRIENNNNAMFRTNGEERFLHDYFQTLSGEVTFFDVGANVGGYSEILRAESVNKKLSYTIHAFEPTQFCFSELRKKFSDEPHVVLNNFGISDAETASEIFYDEQGSGFASLYQRNMSSENITLGKHETIRLQRLDSYIPANNISVIDLLKIDIEGHELQAFRGLGKYLSANFIKAIQFEYGGANLDSHTSLAELYSVLESAGFTLAKIKKNGLEIRPYARWMDNFQYANYVALSKLHFPAIA